MSRKRYELTEEEWEKVKDMLPKKQEGTRGRPPKDNQVMLNGMIWLSKSGAPWRDLPERYGSWETVYTKFRKWLEDWTLDNLFRVLSMEAELAELSIDSTIVRAHQDSAGAKKGGEKTEIGRSRGGLSTKIHAVVDALGYPVYFMLSEGQEADCSYATEVLSHIDITDSDVLADKGYDTDAIIDYIYENGAESTIPSKSNRKVQRIYDEKKFRLCQIDCVNAIS